MIYSQNETHDPLAKSWVESANSAFADFPIQNLPFGVFSHNDGEPRIGVAIGDRVLDLHACAEMRLLGDPRTACASCATSLNHLMSLAPLEWSALRKRLFQLLHASAGKESRGQIEKLLIPMAEARMQVPAHIGDYSDFYASIYHAGNVGSMFRPESPLFPNYKWVPIGYHGRASSIVISGTPVRRPCGQSKAASDQPAHGPSRQLDYELEMAVYVGGGNQLGTPIPIDRAEENIFGVCILNDWSARDVQFWESQPLGPFLGKSFATTVSPWVVTLEALAPYRIPAFQREQSDPVTLPYLTSTENRNSGGIDMALEVAMTTSKMRADRFAPHVLSRGSFRDMYWTVAQLLTHHASNGCNLRPGDLLASGTVSGNSQDSRGCLLELTRRGSEPIQLPTGERRGFLEDGDEVIMRAWCDGQGKARVGFGECRGQIIGSLEHP
jgi:fumarylacetoacetase